MLLPRGRLLRLRWARRLAEGVAWHGVMIHIHDRSPTIIEASQGIAQALSAGAPLAGIGESGVTFQCLQSIPAFPVPFIAFTTFQKLAGSGQAGCD